MAKGERAARRWVREHWAAFIKFSDLMIDTPEGVDEIFEDECDKIAVRLAGKNFDFSTSMEDLHDQS